MTEHDTSWPYQPGTLRGDLYAELEDTLQLWGRSTERLTHAALAAVEPYLAREPHLVSGEAGDLRERVAGSLGVRYHAMYQEALCEGDALDLADAALSVVQPEFDRLRSEAEFQGKRRDAHEDEADRLRKEVDFQRQAHEEASKLWGQADGERTRLRSELADAKWELDRWRSGQRRKGLPTVESVPDAISVASRLLHAIPEFPTDNTHNAMVTAAGRLRDVHDAAQVLMVERDQALSELAESRESIDILKSERQEDYATHDEQVRQLHESVVHLGQKVGELSYERNKARHMYDSLAAEVSKADAPPQPAGGGQDD